MRSYRGFRVPLAIAFVLGVVVKLIMLSADSDTVDMSLPVGAHKLDLDFGPIEDYEEEEEEADDGVKMEKVTVMDLPVPPEVQIHVQPQEPEAEHTDGDTTQLIILFAYMRGGSSFMGGVFETNPQVFYWYEAFWDIYNAMTSSSLWQFPIHVVFDKERQLRNITAYERSFVRKQMRQLFTCQLSKVPAEMLTSWTLGKSPRCTNEYAKCLGKYKVVNTPWANCQKPLRGMCPDTTSVSLNHSCEQFMEWTRLKVPVNVAGWPESPENYSKCMKPTHDAVGKCVPLLQKECDKRPIKVVKVLRTRMDVMEDLLKEFPKLKVIHELRDPRGTLVSRRKDSRSFSKNITIEADLLCRKMVDDIKTRKRLELKYPNVFFETKYETLASSPVEATEDMYKHSGIVLPDGVKYWVGNTTSAKSDGSSFQLARKNATATAFAWQHKLTSLEKQHIDSVCAELYELADFKV